MKHGGSDDLLLWPAGGGPAINLTATWDLEPNAPRAGAAVEQVTQGERRINSLTFDQAMTKIAYTAGTYASPSEVWVANIDGTSERQLTNLFAGIRESIGITKTERLTWKSMDGTVRSIPSALPPLFIQGEMDQRPLEQRASHAQRAEVVRRALPTTSNCRRVAAIGEAVPRQRSRNHSCQNDMSRSRMRAWRATSETQTGVMRRRCRSAPARAARFAGRGKTMRVRITKRLGFCRSGCGKRPPRAAADKLSQWQKAHLSLPLAFEAALGEQEKIVNRLAERRARPHLEDSWHRLTSSDSVEGVFGHCRDVVRDDDSPLARSSFQNHGVVGAGKTGVLDANNIDRRILAKQASHDVAVEVLVRCKPQHRRTVSIRAWLADVLGCQKQGIVARLRREQSWLVRGGFPGKPQPLAYAEDST